MNEFDLRAVLWTRFRAQCQNADGYSTFDEYLVAKYRDAEAERDALADENARLREALLATTSLRDWLAAGYTIAQYKAFYADGTVPESETRHE